MGYAQVLDSLELARRDLHNVAGKRPSMMATGESTGGQCPHTVDTENV